ncbi:MAG: ArsR family transcriptional regulator [Myxococcaceae bacterium]|jgi:DNA-binding transcriptional ArsR family regulator|nr:ArsR family transcriptional regulator [Myxococcaceae bacterium]
MQLDVFQTLGDPTRRRIVEALRHGEQQVGDVVEMAGVHQSGVSRHLRILYESGFVSMRADGQRRLYSLKPEPFRELDDWLGPYRRLWAARLDRFESALGKKQDQARRAEDRKKRK